MSNTARPPSGGRLLRPAARALALGALALVLLGSGDVHAAECRYRAPNGAVPGTLAAGPSPCEPARQPAPKGIGKGTAPPASGRPGLFKNGDTTMHIGGAVQAGVSAGSR